MRKLFLGLLLLPVFVSCTSIHEDKPLAPSDVSIHKRVKYLMVVVENANDKIEAASFCKIKPGNEYVVYHETRFNYYTCTRPDQRLHKTDVIEPWFSDTLLGWNQRTVLSNGTVLQFYAMNLAGLAGSRSASAGDYVLASRGVTNNVKRLKGETQVFSFPESGYIRYIGKAKIGEDTFVWEPLGDLKMLLDNEIPGFSKLELVDEPPTKVNTSCKANPVDFGKVGWSWPSPWGNVQSVSCTLQK